MNLLRTLTLFVTLLFCTITLNAEKVIRISSKLASGRTETLYIYPADVTIEETNDSLFFNHPAWTVVMPQPVTYTTTTIDLSAVYKLVLPTSRKQQDFGIYSSLTTAARISYNDRDFFVLGGDNLPLFDNYTLTWGKTTFTVHRHKE